VTAAGTKAWRWIAGSIATLVIGAALVVGALRVAIAQLPDLQARVTEQVRVQTGLQLSFDSLDARLGRYGPEVFFEGARVVGAERGEVLVVARAGRVSLAVLRSLLHRRVEIGRVILEAPRLDFLIFPDRHIELAGQAGIALDPDRPRREFSLERLPRGVVEIRDATFGFRDLGLEGADFELSHVDLELSRGARDIAVDGSVDLPRRFGDRLDFSAEAAGDLADHNALDWRLALDAREIDFAGVVESFPRATLLPSAGRGSLRLEARGEGRVLAEATVAMDFEDLVLPPVTDGVPAAYSRAAAVVGVERNGGRWQLDLRGLELSMEERPWERGSVEATFETGGGRLERVALKAGFLRLENLLPLLDLAPASASLDLARALAPRGILRDVDLVAGGFVPGRLPDLEGELRFAGLGLSPRGRAPGFDGLTGRIEAKGAQGVAVLEARDLAVDWPAEWRATQAFPAFSAQAGWQRVPDGLRLWADDVAVNAGHGQVDGRVHLLLRPGQTPLMDITAQVRDFDAAEVSRYLPVSRLKPKPLGWLDAAFRGGRIVRGEIAVTGPARGFPYREDQGRFEAQGRIEGLALAFAPGWPLAEDLDFDVTFAGPGFSVGNLSGRLADVQVPRATAELADWRESLLILRADVAGDAGAAQRLLAGSPLGPRLGPTFARLEASGRLAGEAVLLLPLKSFADRMITVRAGGKDLRLGLTGLEELVTGLEGELTVHNNELHAPRLVGEALGGAFEASIDTRRAASGALTTVVEASGTLDGARLPALLRLPVKAELSGNASWRGTWSAGRTSPDGGPPGRSLIRIESDLVGLASGLPAPLAKAPAARLPLRIALEPLTDGALIVDAAVGRDVRALLRMERGARGRLLDRGVVRLGGGEAAPLPVAPGVRIEGRVAALSVSDLLELRSPQPGGRRLQDWLAGVELDVGRLEVLGYEFERVSGRMRPAPLGWDIDVASPSAAGRVLVPYDFDGDAPLALDMERLFLGTRVRRGEGKSDPRSLPNVRLDVRAATFERYELGHLEAELRRQPEGVSLERFQIRHTAYSAQGSGRWTVGPAGQRGALDLELDSGDAKGLLSAFGFAPLVDARAARLEARLAWPGAPDGELLGRVSGDARLRFTEGRLLTVDPGAGRVLGLMSLAHLPRRLALDFHDVTDEGLAFDSITGDFRLVDGSAYTDNLVLRGPASEIGIAGRTGLGDRSYDQTAVVTGQLGASLGVAGALAAGPAVGAAIFLISQIFKEPLSGAVRAYYRITGPWDSPNVRKIDANELKEAAGLSVAPAPPGGTP
jgi:uncharacterized protein (TIGR02099 family)